MAKKYYDGELNLNLDWGGTETQLPLSGGSVQKIIKDSLNSKIGYLGRIDKTGQGFYVLSRDEATFNAYRETITDDKPFGDIDMDGIEGRRFDAPFNYKMNITLLNPENGYKSTLLGSTGNIIKFSAETRDANDSPQNESLTITFKVITEGGVESSQTLIYDGKKAAEGIEYNLDGKLGSGQNRVIITAVGMNTGISAMRNITYRLIDMNFSDKFNIIKRYQFTANGTMAMNVGYSLKGVGKTRIVWYFDGSTKPYRTTEIANTNPNLSNASEAFYFTESSDKWLTPGIHNIQMSMICKDTDSGEEFQTPIYYREFIVETTPAMLETPYIIRKATFPAENGFLLNGETPTIYNVKQYDNVELEYAAYYNGQSECTVSTEIKYPGKDAVEVSSVKLPMENESFSAIQLQTINTTEQGVAEITLKAHYGENYFESGFKADVGASDMNITTVTDSIALSLNASGRSNYTTNKDTWEYTYLNEYGMEEKITTTFSKNEYVLISTVDINGNDVAPTDATDYNTIVVDEMPSSEIEDFKYVKFGTKYYTWTREFDWSNTSGWHDNKLKLAKGNAITIDYKPFSEDKRDSLKERGGTYEFEFETTNVYNDDAVICRIAGNNNFAPGITIYASGAELVVSREVVEPEYDDEGNQINENAGYIKAVSTKYKSEENNRISFVITADGDTNNDGTPYRDRILKIYVNGELCGAYPYDKGANFFNDSTITFRGSDDACVNISSIQIYKRALNSNEILNNYIYFRNNPNEKKEIYERNNIMLDSNDEVFDSDKLKSQLPVMMIYQIDKTQSLDDIHQEKKNKKLTRFFDVVYINIQDPEKNFLIKNAYITPQGTSSMNYPVKNLRLYSGKKNDAGEYYSRMFVGSQIFIDGSPNNLSWDNINLETEVKKKRQYAFKKDAIPVNCWCLKADYAESSSSHNTGTARFWNDVLKTNGFTTKAQVKAAKYKQEYPYDVRTCIDGFPIAVFYQSLDSTSPRFEGKYNFNNDKSTESVFGFTGGCEIPDQPVQYFYIGKTSPIVHGETDTETGEVDWACDFESGGYTETPTTDSPLYASKILDDGSEEWYMLRGIELLDNPKMECWELLNSVNEIALFKTMKGFGVGDDDEKVGIVDGENFDEAFESRYPDCGDYFHTNSLKRFGEWLVSCRYLDIDSKTGESVPFTRVPSENYHKNDEGKLSICSLTKQRGEFIFNFPDYNFYKEISYDIIASSIKNEGYQVIDIKDEDIESLEYKEVEVLPTIKDNEYEYLKCGDFFYTWMPSNLLEADEKPSVHESAYDYVKVGDIYYVWDNKYKFENYYETQWVDDTAFNRALKFAIEKYDHIEMNKMAAYYIYLMRFGGVDQTVKNSMLTTEGPATDDPNSTLPSLWYFINYDNDTILGVKNDGRLVFDPYITRQTKDGTGYVYAGRESTLWNNLEADVQFMDKVTEVDNILAEGEADSLYALAYDNAIREYDINQSDKWCERIYNKDAERKYIQTYVEGWTQKVDKDGTATHVYEDYLYDVQGSRSAHRKWWLGRRFNVFDSRFCNTNFRNSLIKFRSTNLPAGSSFTIKSGEPIFYAWGHDNAVTEMTPNAIQPGDSYTFTTKSAFNIGSYLELMGSANISTLNLRNCVGALTEIDVNGCYSSSVGTKMKEILVGDHTRTDLVNISNTSMKFSGLNKASKLEVLDMTNIRNAMAFDGLEKLLNIREIYAKGTSVSNFTFADGSMIEKLELPASTETLSLTRSSAIEYDHISFDGGQFGNLTNLTINNCNQLMSNPNFVLNWIVSKPETQRPNLSLNLQGIDWKFDMNNYSSLFLLENVGTAANAQRNIRGVIEINSFLNISDVNRLKTIFGNDCFKEGSTVYIKASTSLYINTPDVIWEGESDVRCDITTVGTTLNGELRVSAMVDDKVIGATNGVVTMDTSNLSRGYVTVSIQESDNTFEYFVLTATYVDTAGNEMMQVETAMVKKRIYPTTVTVESEKDSYNNKTPNALTAVYRPSTINDLNLEGRGNFSVSWSMLSGSTDYQNKLVLLDSNKEIAYIQAEQGFDGTVVVEVVVTRNYDNKELCRSTKEIEFTNPDTIITKFSNEKLYTVLVNNGIIVEDESGFGKMTKLEAAMLTMEDIIKNGKSIFAGTNIESFLEFQYFSNSFMGQMPKDGVDAIVTPDGLFKDCKYLKEISFSSNFKYTANDMFNGCTRLKYIYGPQTNSVDENGKPVYASLSFEYIGNNFAYRCSALKQCMLSPATLHIGSQAFYECQNLGEFRMPNDQSLNLVYNTNYTPFAGCKNIYFTGANYDDATATAKYRIKNGACYEIRNDGTLGLLHLGKNTLMSDIPSDKTVYAYPYSMEYRTETNLVVPDNVVFDGYGIFSNSKGDSVTLNQLLSGMIASGLFEETQFKKYNFAAGETLIPSDCFRDITYSGIASLTLPEGITTIGTNAFRDCRGLVELILPTTMETISSNAFWTASNLKTVFFKSATLPSFDAEPTDGTFRGVMLKDIYVLPEYYETYANTISNLYKPHLKPKYAYAEGYIRVVKDGSIIFSDESNVIKVGNVDVIVGDNDYMKYTTDTNTLPVITLNGEEIGYVKEKYTTIYIGDNSSLYSGDGYDFTHGVYDAEVLSAMNTAKWSYDRQFGGIRSQLQVNSGFKTAMSFPLSKVNNTNFDVEYGIFTVAASEAVFIDSNNTELLKVNGRASGLHKIANFDTSGNVLKVQYTKGQTTASGIDGIVINKIGNPIFTEPSLTPVSMMSTDGEISNVNMITVNLVAEQNIPNNVVVTVSDGFAHTYRQTWNGSPLIFVVPKNFTFNVSATDFITESGKTFELENEIMGVTNGNVELSFKTNMSAELNDNVLCWRTPYTDYYILLERHTEVWSTVNNTIENICTDEILLSDTDGLVNTQTIYNLEQTNSMFRNALETTVFGKGIKGYIPSYIELSILSAELPRINEYLLSNGKEPLDITDCWVSEMFDAENAWTSDGIYKPKSEFANYYIFGKRIML